MKVEVALPERETYGKQLLEGERHSGTEGEASFAGQVMQRRSQRVHD